MIKEVLEVMIELARSGITRLALMPFPSPTERIPPASSFQATDGRRCQDQKA